MVWNDLNENGMIDSGENFSGTTVKLGDLLTAAPPDGRN